MTRDEIIKLAREAGFHVGISEQPWGSTAFAQLCQPYPSSTDLYRMLEACFHAAYAAGAAAEREACAKVSETLGVHPALNVYNGGPDWYKHGKEIAAAIRARGTT